MPYHRISDPLQCFNAHLYATLEECDNHPDQCIAPKKDKTRCTRKIFSTYDKIEAKRLRQQAENLPNSQERDAAVCQFILLHCCKSCHRKNLEDDNSGCLESIIETYSAKIGMIVESPTNEETMSEVRQDAQTPALSVEPKENSGEQDSSAAETSGGMTLRSGTTISRTTNTPTGYRRKTGYFVPYKSGPRDSIRSDLLKDVPSHAPKRGMVYSFTSPEHTEYVKIGYSHSAEQRVETWQTCNPGALLSKKVAVEYPNRIERLIHLEMAQHRYRINQCKVCGCGHVEWFKLPVEQANQVIGDWEEVTRREPLYDSNGKLTQSWRTRINGLESGITARGLLDFLDAEVLQTAMFEADLLEADLVDAGPFDGYSHEAELPSATSHEAAISDADFIAVAEALEQQIKDSNFHLPDTLVNTESITLSVDDTTAQNSAIATDPVQQQDLLLTYFEDFLSLLAEQEDLRTTNVQQLAQDSALVPSLLPSEPAVCPNVALVA